MVAFERLQGRRTGWSLIGWMGVVASFLILSFYIVVAGWSMDYAVKHLVDFGGPIREAATERAMAYEATATTDQMRTMLVDAKAEAAVEKESAAGASRQTSFRSKWRMVCGI